MAISNNPERRGDPRPNIIFIITDQQRYDTIRALGFPHVESPHMDRLVNEGISFTNAFVTAPSCAPSRASLFTGLYPHNNGVFVNNRDPWPGSWVENLNQVGYYCVNIGKMHTAPWDAPCGFHERYVVENKDRFRADRWFFDEWDRALRIRGVEKPSRATYAQWPDYEERLGSYEWTLPEDLHPDNFVGDMATWWIEQHDKRWWDAPAIAKGHSHDTSVLQKPLFLQIGFPGPHPPYDPLQSYIDKYADKELPIVDPPPESIDRQPQGLRKLRELMLERNPDAVKHLPNPTREQRHRQRAYYLANVSMIDTKIGEILQTLEETGYLENAVVIFTSDHGDSLGDHGHSQKWNMYEETTHVPLVFWGPSHFANPRQVDDLVELFDVGATILEMAQAQRPEWMEAQSLLPLLNDTPGARGRDYVFAEHAKDDYLPTIEYMTMVRSNDWKLVHFAGETEGQLFHLAHDPHELHDLWDDTAAQAQKRHLLSELREWLVRSNVKAQRWSGR